MTTNFVKRDIYDEACAIINRAQKKEKSIKSLVYESNSKNIRQLYALVCESLKYAAVIDEIMENTAFLQKVSWMDKNLALVLLYDFLFGKKLAGACSGKYRKAVVKQKKDLKAELQRMKETKGVTNSSGLLPSQVKDEVSIPRYVRVNLLKTSVDDVIMSFIKAGYTCVMTREEAALERQETTPQYISNLSVDVSRSLGQYEFAADLHLDDVLVFKSGTDFHNHPLYLQGHIILMDKASCFPAYVLSAEPGSHVIDACSAPGNKTSHMASLIRNEGQIYSYDLDLKRLGVMKNLLDRAGVSVAKTIHQDFMTSDPSSEDNLNVEYIIVDPSCSGSGMANRKDYLVDDSMGEDTARLESLHQLQCRILSHALSFPSARRVVYSTCSVHRRENEDVVRAVLAENDGFRLVPVMQDTWDHRGLSCGEDEGLGDVGQCCVRASPHSDLTNGFFVALFERKGKIGNGTSERITSNGHSSDDNHSKKKKKTVIPPIGDPVVETHEGVERGNKNKDKTTQKKHKKNKNEMNTEVHISDESDVEITMIEKKKKKKQKKEKNEMNAEVQSSNESDAEIKPITKKNKKKECKLDEDNMVDNEGKGSKKIKSSKRKVAPESETSQNSAKKKKKSKK